MEVDWAYAGHSALSILIFIMAMKVIIVGKSVQEREIDNFLAAHKQQGYISAFHYYQQLGRNKRSKGMTNQVNTLARLG